MEGKEAGRKRRLSSEPGQAGSNTQGTSPQRKKTKSEVKTASIIREKEKYDKTKSSVDARTISKSPNNQPKKVGALIGAKTTALSTVAPKSTVRTTTRQVTYPLKKIIREPVVNQAVEEEEEEDGDDMDLIPDSEKEDKGTIEESSEAHAEGDEEMEEPEGSIEAGTKEEHEEGGIEEQEQNEENEKGEEDENEENEAESESEAMDTAGLYVFQCASCRTIIGDSLAWHAADDELNTVTLKMAKGVDLDSEMQLSTSGPDKGCTYYSVLCKNEKCRKLLGKFYYSTPKSLANLQELYTLNLAALNGYLLGASSQVPMILHGRYDQLVEDVRELKRLFVAMQEFRESLDDRVSKLEEVVTALLQKE